MEKRLTSQEEKNRVLEELQNSYLEEIDDLSRSNTAAKEDIDQLKEELVQIARKYEESNIKMIDELRRIDMLSINQAIEIISLRSLLPKLTVDNGKKLLNIIEIESKFNEDVKAAAETILEVLDSPDVIPTFIGLLILGLDHLI